MDFEGNGKKVQKGFTFQDEEKSEEVVACNPWDLSECYGTTTVPNYPAVTDEDARAENKRYNAFQNKHYRGF